MADATVTSKGQITIPKDVRDAVGLHEGVRIGFVVRDDGVIEMRPRKRDLTSLFGMLQVPEGQAPLSVADMDDAIAEAVIAADKRTRTR